jgi:hypothetical protein
LISDDLQLLRETIDDDGVFYKICGCYKKQTIIFIKNYDLFMNDSRSQFLRKYLSDDKLNKVYEYFRGLPIYFPESIEREKINEAIYEDYKFGLSYKELVRKYGRTIDNIRKICSRYRAMEPDNWTKQCAEMLNNLNDK